MKKIVISQPMYMPWRGIFEQIKLCDVFLFYDNVELPLGTHKTFITRVQIKTEKGQEWLSVPIIRSGRSHQCIKDAEFVDIKWKNNHITKIKMAYKNTPFFEEVYETLIEPIYKYETNLLSDFCINSIKLVCGYIGLNPEFHISSQLAMEYHDDASQRVLDICLHFKASEHIAGHGAKNYMNHEIFERNNIATKYMEYKLTPYPQLYGEFNPFVSIIDLLFNVGRESNKYLDSEAIYWKDLDEFK